MEIVCINCATTFQDNTKLFFCPFCLTQIKCKSCFEMLIKNAVGCISCGVTLNNTEGKKSELNQIEFEQKGDFKKFKAIFTDNIGHELVTTFGGIVGVPISKKRIMSLGFGKTNQNMTIENDNINDAEIIEGDEEISEALNKVFKLDGDKLVFQTSNYKERNKLDKEIRMSLLILLGYKHLHNTEEIKRKTLSDILKKSKLNSGNFRRWISKCEEIVSSSGGVISLTPTGNSVAHQILNEIFDNSVSVGIIATSKHSTASRRIRSTSNESTGSTNKSSKSPKMYLDRIISEGFFNNKRTLSQIIEHLKNDHAINLKSNSISGIMGKYVNTKTLKREKGPNGYEYFV